ncbi:unnamed protein product, partial [Mycena citricolor]
MNSSSFDIAGPLGIGAIELGVFGALILFGILIVQTYVYFVHTGSEDLKSLRIMVAIVFLFEVAHTITIIIGIFQWTVVAGDRKTRKMPGIFIITNLLETLVTTVVQSHFAHRVYRFTRNPWLTFSIAPLILLRAAGGIVLSALTFVLDPRTAPGQYFPVQNLIGWLVSATFIAGAVVDALIAAGLCFYVRKWKSPSAGDSLESTVQLCNRIMFWSIQTGLITSAFSIATFLCFQLMPHNYVWIGVLAVLGKVYSNSLLSSLNVRAIHRAHKEKVAQTILLFRSSTLAFNDTEVAVTSNVQVDRGSIHEEHTQAPK